MAAYTDGIHLIADSVKELHSFARKIELNGCWYHKPKKRTDGKASKHHYDLGSGTGKAGAAFRQDYYERAIAAGAIKKTSKEIVEILASQNFY